MPLTQSSVSPTEFAALMAQLRPFAAGNRVAVAVSGGADSMALAILLARWGQPTALIVDHGLRPESGYEAAMTAGRLAAVGIDAHVLPIALRPGPALAERARAARYAALSAACRSAGLTDLLLAHHAQDQAETLLLRSRAGSGPGGLAGMAMASYSESVRLLRPLLPIMPARLRATLRDAGVEWVEDSSNNDLATPRGRMRAAFRQGAASPVSELCAEARQYGRERRGDEVSVAAELALHASLLPSGVAVVSGSSLSAGALSALVWAVSGAEHPPPRAAVARVAGRLRPATLHGAAILHAQDGWLIGREAAAQAPAERAEAGVEWDGRFRLVSRPPGNSVIGPLGDDSAALRRWSSLPAALLRTLPAIRYGGVLFAVPHLSYPDVETSNAVPILFCPRRPAAPAPFSLDRLGGDAKQA